MKTTILSTLLSTAALSGHGFAQSVPHTVGGGASGSVSFSTPFIWNQYASTSRSCQDPYLFMVGCSLNDDEAVQTICFDNAADSINTFGLQALGSQLTDKGQMVGVSSNLSMDSYSGQAGRASGRIASVQGFFAGGYLAGVSGEGYAESLDNFGPASTSSALGGSFLGGSDPSAAPMTFNAGTGTWLIGGVRGELRGQFDATPTNGALAGVIGIDSSTGDADSYAGWFDGDVHVTGDVYGSTITPSSKRWKDQIETLEDPLDLLVRLRGVRYRWIATGENEIGFVAEEVADVLPEIVAFEHDGKTARGVEYGRISALLVESVKAQQEIIERQEAKVEDLRAELEGLRALLTK